MKRLQVAVIGLGRLGSACALALLEENGLALAGIVRRADAQTPVPARLRHCAVASHVRDLPAVDLALVCVPTEAVAGVARELLQARIPVVECAQLEGQALAAHHAALDTLAQHHRVTAVTGAGVDPGVLPLFAHAFELLIPHGQSREHRHPGVNLHHSAALAHLRGLREALVGEWRGAGGVLQRYVYAVPEPGADVAALRAAVEADPLFAGEPTQFFAVDDLAEVEAEQGQGWVLERRSSEAAGTHASLLLEARFELAGFAARVMLDAARRLPTLRHGAHRYSLGL